MGIWGGSPLPPSQGFWRQEISFHVVKVLIFGTLRLFMKTTTLFVIANVKQLRT